MQVVLAVQGVGSILNAFNAVIFLVYFLDDEHVSEGVGLNDDLELAVESVVLEPVSLDEANWEVVIRVHKGLKVLYLGHLDKVSLVRACSLLAKH